MSRSELEDVKFSLNETSLALPKADAARPITLSLRIQLANALNSLDDPKRAGELCGEVLEANPNHKHAYMIWIDAALRGKDFSKAIELIENALARFVDDVDLRLKKANALESTGHRDEAIALLQILRIEQPENHNLKINLARKLMAAGKPSAADAVFLEVLGKDAKNREAWIGRLNVAAASGDHQSVADKAERALEYLPKDDVLIIRAGQAMAKTGRIVEGVELLRETIAGSSAPSVNIRLAFAGLLQETGELQEADNIIQMVLTEQPENPAALNRYIGMALTRGDVDAGLTRCENALKKLPDNMPLMRRKAMLQRQVGRLDDAINLLQTMLRTDPNDGVSGIELARTLMMKKDFDSAEVIFVDVLKRHPSNRAALLGQVDIAEARGDLELAMALLEQM
jgi:predicted Zn-dependent protease